MLSVRHADITNLPTGTVLLVNTQDEYLKLVIDEDIGIFTGQCIHVSTLSESEEETDKGIFTIANITVGKPISGAAHPEKQEDGTIKVGAILKTTPVERIEVY